MFCILPFTTQHGAYHRACMCACDIDCRLHRDCGLIRNVQLISNCTQTLSVLNYRYINPRGSSVSAAIPSCLLAVVLLGPGCGWRWWGE